MKQKSLLLSLLSALLIIALLVAGCGKTDTASSEATKTVTFKNQQYTVPKDPKRIVVLSNSILPMLDAVGGKAVGRVFDDNKLPANLQSIPDIGHPANPNMEKLLSLHPDLVIGLASQDSKLKAQLESNHIPYILLNYDGINDNVPLLTFLGDITNQPDKAKVAIAKYQKEVAAVKDAIKGQQPAKVAVLRATGKSVTAETKLAVTASMVSDLGMNNVVLQHGDFDTKAKTVPYSLETLATDNPDIIFIVTMGKKSEIDATMTKEMTSNPAWNQLKAVQTGKVFYLPSNLFLLNPGLQTPNAMAQLVKDAYGLNVTL